MQMLLPGLLEQNKALNSASARQGEAELRMLDSTSAVGAQHS